MRNYLSVDNEIEWRDSFANRETSGGDAAVTGSRGMPAYGVPV